jgi:hypothetical protein
MKKHFLDAPKVTKNRFRGHEGRFQNEIGDYDVKANENIHPRI